MLRHRSGSPGHLAVPALAAVAMTACGTSTALVGITPADVPTSSFSVRRVPDGQPTWVHVILHGGKPPFHGRSFSSRRRLPPPFPCAKWEGNISGMTVEARHQLHVDPTILD